MPATKPIIEFKNLILSFGSKTIFDNFSLSIKPRQKVVIFGKSGTGKSTLLKLLLGFEQLDSGAISVAGKVLTPKTLSRIRTRIAYVDQDVMMGEGIVSAIIDEYFSFTANKPHRPNLEQLQQKLAHFELEPEILKKDIANLSGGERQRLALAVALLLKRPILVLDEITSSLDPVSKGIVIDKLLAETQTTMLIITHDQEWQTQKGVKVFDFKEKIWI